jgi:hypothetical protein
MHVTTTIAVPPRRLAYAALAALLLAATAFEAAKHGLWLPAVVGLVAPDLTLAFGGGAGLARGQLHPRAVGLYNAVHRFWGPLVLLAAASFGVLGLGWFVAGAAWAAHVAVDRSAGYGLRDPAGFQR